MARIGSFRDLDVYKTARAQALVIFQLTKQFPREELYSLTDQIRRSSRAVGVIVAEGWARRRYEAAFVNKLSEAMGETMETQSWPDSALDCGYIIGEQHAQLDDRWQHIGAMLNRMIDRSADFCKDARKRR